MLRDVVRRKRVFENMPKNYCCFNNPSRNANATLPPHLFSCLFFVVVFAIFAPWRVVLGAIHQMLLQCAHILKAIKWELLIVDEAHRCYKLEGFRLRRRFKILFLFAFCFVLF